MRIHPEASTSPSEARRAAKREEILGVTWRLIAEQGLRAANMRAIAAAAGYANGALAYYFAGKEELLRAAFTYVFDRTQERIAEATSGLKGLSALRTMCREILPEDGDKLLEARIVLPFWAEAAHDQTFADLHERSMQIWRTKMKRHLREAATVREICPLSPKETTVVVEQLMNLLMGAQVMGVLSPAVDGPPMLHAMVERLLMSLGAEL